MDTLTVVLSTIQLICSLVLVGIIILQPGKSAGLSGAISGGAETFFGKNKGRTIEAKLEKATSFVAVAFVVLTLILFFVNK
jgi:preprotein translocase subunit SecG